MIWREPSLLPEVQVIHRALLVSHVNVKREEVDGGQCAPTKDFEESGQTIPLLHVEERVWRCHLDGLLTIVDDLSPVKFPTLNIQITDGGRKRGRERVRSRG